MIARVVVTGMAIWSPYGRGVETFWEGMISGHSGRSAVTRFDVSHSAYRTQAAAEITQLGNEASGETEATALHLLREVVKDALADSNIDSTAVSPYDVAVCLCASQGISKSFRDYLVAKRGGTMPVNVFNNIRLTAASLLGEVATLVGAQGPALMVATACASGTNAIGTAYNLIRQGRVRRAFVGGIGYFSEISMSGFNILRLTGREGCRPFDIKRDGMMLGDGIAMIVMEEETLARERGAAIKARILGYACGNEAHHSTSPDPNGNAATRVMWDALNRSPDLLARLDYINAHGTGTEANDTAELAAMQGLMQMRGDDYPVAVSSTKGYHGHSLDAVGIVEFIATVLSLNKHIILPSFGLREPEPGFDKLNLVRDSVQSQTIRLALSNSFAFGGNVAAISAEATQ